MVENPEEEIMLSPENAIILDGNGYEAMSLGGMPSQDKDGREIVTYRVHINDKTKKRYNLRRGYELNDRDVMKIIFLKIDLIILNPYDDANRKIMYVKSFKHEPTEMSNREANLKVRIDELNKKVNRLEAIRLKYAEQLHDMSVEPSKFLKQGADLALEIGRAQAEAFGKRPEGKDK